MRRALNRRLPPHCPPTAEPASPAANAAGIDPFYASGVRPEVLHRPPVLAWEGPNYRIVNGGILPRLRRTHYELALNAVSGRLYSFVLTLAGTVTFECGGRSVALAPGTLIAFPQPLAARLCAVDGQLCWKHFYLNFEGEMAAGYFRHVVARHGWVTNLSRSSNLMLLAARIHRLTQDTHPGSVVAWSREGFRWLDAWYENAARVPPNSELSGLDLWNHCVPVPPANVRSVAAFARVLGYTRQHTSRLLSQQWDRAPAQGLRLSWLDHAAADLRATDAAVAAVAARYGYRSVSSFIRAFKATFRATPLRYRRQMR